MFSYGDMVRVATDAPTEMHPGEKASVVGITPNENKLGSHFEQFPRGTVYLIEFGDGEAIDIHESMIEAVTD
jgi:hypothetical protein